SRASCSRRPTSPCCQVSIWHAKPMASIPAAGTSGSRSFPTSPSASKRHGGSSTFAAPRALQPTEIARSRPWRANAYTPVDPLDLKCTLNDPLTTTLTVALVPSCGSSVNEYVPVAAVALRELNVTVPVPCACCAYQKGSPGLWFPV